MKINFHRDRAIDTAKGAGLVLAYIAFVVGGVAACLALQISPLWFFGAAGIAILVLSCFSFERS